MGQTSSRAHNGARFQLTNPFQIGKSFQLPASVQLAEPLQHPDGIHGRALVAAAGPSDGTTASLHVAQRSRAHVRRSNGGFRRHGHGQCGRNDG